MKDCETNDCRKEKMGCNGCYYDKDAEIIEELKNKKIRKFANNPYRKTFEFLDWLKKEKENK